MGNLLDKASGLFRSKDYIFHTDLSVGECIELLKQSITEEDEYWLSWKTKRFAGKIDGNRFLLLKSFCRWGMFIHYSFEEYYHFNGEFVRELNGTKIIGYFGFNKIKINKKWIIFYLAIYFMVIAEFWLFRLPLIYLIILFLITFITWLSILLITPIYFNLMKDDIFKLFKTTFQATPLFPSERANIDLPDNSSRQF